MTYTREEILEKINIALNMPATLYRQDVFNYRGQVDGEQYTEISAKELLKHIDLLDLKIQTISRSNYKVISHDKLSQGEQPIDSKRNEEWLAKKMYRDGDEFEFIGKILDYQIPLKSTKEDDTGKIDLFSYNKQTQKAYILELKRGGNTETFLRCVLEIFTYGKRVDSQRLLESYDLPSSTNLCKAVIVTKDCQAYNDFQHIGANLRQLMNKLGVDFFVLDRERNHVVEN